MSTYTTTRTFSFSKINDDVLEYVDKQPNKSEFVSKAIRFYIDNKDLVNTDVVSKSEYDKLLIENKALKLALETIYKMRDTNSIDKVDKTPIDKNKKNGFKEKVKSKSNIIDSLIDSI